MNQNSTSGPSKSVDLVALVEAASRSGARSLKLIGILEVEFGEAPVTLIEESPGAGVAIVKEEPREVTARDELAINEQNNDELIYTNPLEYERLQAEG